MDTKLGLALISMTVALNGCVTSWIVAEAREPRGRPASIEIHTEVDNLIVSWRRIHTEEDDLIAGWRSSDSAGLIPRKFVLELEGETVCSEFDFYANGDIPLFSRKPTRVSPISVDAPILVTADQPCTIMLTYGAVGEAGFYGLVVSTDKGPIREIPLTGKPYLWLLTPFGVASDAAVVGTVLLVLVFVGPSL